MMPKLPAHELYAVTDDYLGALAARDPSRLAWAARVVFSENNVQLLVGDGLWNTITAVRPGYDLKAADPATGEVSWFGVIEESGQAGNDGAAAAAGWRADCRS